MEKKEIVDKFLEQGVLIEPQALEKAVEIPPDVLEELLRSLAERGVLVAREEDLKVPGQEPSSAPSPVVEILLEETEIGSDNRMDYLRFFQNRFDRLASVIKGRKGFADARSIMEVKSRPGEPSCTIGMVSDHARTRGGHHALVVEDGTGRMRALAVKGSEASGVAAGLVLDEVIGLRGRYDGGKKVFLIESICFPDIEEQKGALSQEVVHAAFLSDIHFGSTKFMESSFTRFIDWLAGRYGDAEMRESARLTRHVVICGDLIDSSVADPLQAYRDLASLLREIPREVAILAIPGEHDMAGVLEPQADFLPEALSAFSELSNFVHGGNPLIAKLNSVPVLLYHGRALEDWSSSLGAGDTCAIMKEMLVRRHIAPTYGSAVPVAPAKRDPFLIRHPPRIMCLGHSHRECTASYKGVLLLGASSWMSSDQEGGCGTVHVVDLSTLRVRRIRFPP